MSNDDFLPPLVVPEAYPYTETDDLFSGPDLNPELLALLPYVGVWRGVGKGGYPGVEDFEYGQQVRFSHDGRGFLYYEARAWIVDADLQPVRPAFRESGWWRPLQLDNSHSNGRRRDELEVLINNPQGVTEIYVGTVDGTTVELATDVVARTATARDVTALKRIYGIVDDTLLYAVDMAAGGNALTSHLSARLRRIRNGGPQPESIAGVATEGHSDSDQADRKDDEA